MTLAYYPFLITGINSDRTGGTWTNLLVGWKFYETDTHMLYFWSGSAWSNMAASPIVFGGARTPTFGATAYQTLFQSNVSTASSTEANTTVPLNFTFAPTKLSVKVASNTMNANTIISFRDDAADVTNATVTVASTDGAGTLKESSAITAVVASGSLVCWKVDASASGSGTAVFAYIIQGYIY